jgi:four helix bundle suffix protein
MSRDFLPARGNYHKLVSYQKAEVIYDITFRFCERFLKKSDRTIDQMIQAARSGKQNIAEGSKAGLTSSETEIKLTNVARSSLEELLADYQDFLRVRDLKLWTKASQEAMFVRRLSRRKNSTAAVAERVHDTFENYREFVETRDAEVVANIAICLIHQANYLLDQQLRALEQEFVKTGGIREQMTKARMAARQQVRR